jgi:2-dehydro-3-deoxygluconokinase
MDLLCFGEPMVEFNDQSNGTFLFGFGGDVSNVAVAAARQGAATGLATRLGLDSFGDDLMQLYAREGIATTAIERDSDAPTGLYFVRHGDDGHRFEYRRAGSAASLLSPATLPIEAIANARCLHLSGISQAISDSAKDACDAAIFEAKRAGALVSYDPNLRVSLWPLERARTVIHAAAAQADIFLPGYEDAVQLTGLTAPEAIAQFYLDLGAKLVALTLGEDGALIATPQGLETVSAPTVQAVDASGAGDCFDGAFLARMLAGDTPLQAAQYAVSAAALSVQGFGAIAPIPTVQQVHAFMGH